MLFCCSGILGNASALAFSVGPTCDDGSSWKLCTDACKKASCTKNPEAKCVAPMGGCGPDACKPKFYDNMGREVQCKLSWHQNDVYRLTIKNVLKLNSVL